MVHQTTYAENVETCQLVASRPDWSGGTQDHLWRDDVKWTLATCYPDQSGGASDRLGPMASFISQRLDLTL
jgi:hypothetical protein